MNTAQVNLWQLSNISPHGPWSTCSHLASLKLGSCCLRIGSVQSLAGETWGVRSVDARLEIPQKIQRVQKNRFYWLGVDSPKIGSSRNYSCNILGGFDFVVIQKCHLLGLIRWKSRPPSLRHVSQFCEVIARVQGKHGKIGKVESSKMNWTGSTMFPIQSKTLQMTSW